MNEREQVPLTPELVEAVLAAVEQKGVLVGGQALAIWISIFELTAHQAGSAPISIDADFLGDRDLVTQIKTNIPGSTAKYQLRSAISCLIGVVEIPLAGDQFMSVDVIDSVPPLTEEHVFERAISLTTPENKSFLVLHPVDLLTSRAYNLRNFKEKQNANGIEQLRMSLHVVHAYLCAALSDPTHERQVLKIVEEIVRLAKGPSGAAAKAYGVDFLTGIPLDHIGNDSFQTLRRPRLVRELADVRPPSYLVGGTMALD